MPFTCQSRALNINPVGLLELFENAQVLVVSIKGRSDAEDKFGPGWGN
jgi:hypothetical protein